MMIGVLGLAALSIPVGWIVFLTMFIIAKVGFATSLIFYDSMLVDITTSDRIDEVSSHGYAWGYIGSCIPFTYSLLLILGCDTIVYGYFSYCYCLYYECIMVAFNYYPITKEL